MESKIPKEIEDRIKTFLRQYKIEWPPKLSLVVDEEKQAELIGMPVTEKPQELADFVAQVISYAALTSDKDLRNAVLVARLTRPMGIFFWILRFVYESRGHTFQHDDS